MFFKENFRLFIFEIIKIKKNTVGCFLNPKSTITTTTTTNAIPPYLLHRSAAHKSYVILEKMQEDFHSSVTPYKNSPLPSHFILSEGRRRIWVRIEGLGWKRKDVNHWKRKEEEWTDMKSEAEIFLFFYIFKNHFSFFFFFVLFCFVLSI